MMNKDIFRQILVVLATLATIGVNALASALPLNGQTTGEISDRFDVFFVPAGYVFSIWGLIYLALLAYSVFQALPSQAQDERLRSIGYLYILSAVANTAWIFLWHYEFFPLSVVAMLALLGLLIAIYLRLDIGRTKVSSAMKWFVHVPFSIYLGWITVATIANITSVLYILDWNGWGFSPEAWSLIMLAAAVTIGAAVSLTRGDVAFGAVLIWAFAGIAIKHEDTAIVATASWLAAAITAVFILIGAYHHRQRNRNAALAT
jgi:hypothetical protein